ncbi:MAG: Trk system potassium transporter TrkA [Limnochordia bacterium]|jgi:trk system potassium uptake protein TrkA|nr:Trk system potassium transporter TrkA [Limnochordia bacterium]
MNIVIVGMGKLGSKLAETLASEDNNIRVVDTSENVLERIVNRVDVLTIQGNGVQLELLEDLDMKGTDLVVATTGSDEINILICLAAKRLGCQRVVARVRNPEYANQIEFFKDEFEIDFITNPELDTALDIARYVLRGYAAHMESFAGGKVGLFDVPSQSLPHLVGKRLADIDSFQEILVVALYRDGEVIIPSGATELREQDILYLMGRRETVTNFTRRLSSLGERHITRKVMILGGGRAGFYLAQRLLVSGLAVKIIEQDEERCNYLVSSLKGAALVLCGDCTDLELLQDENLSEMDALVSLTGNDEENLMLALLGKQQGVPKVVAKVSRSNFVPLIEQLGIDRAVNPVLISSGEVSRFVQGGEIASLSLMFGGQAEAVEIVVPEGAPIIGHNLVEAKIPSGLIIGAIVRRGQVLIPAGDSVIESGDRAIVFCLRSEISSLNSLFHSKQRGLLHELWHGGKGSRKRPTN